MAMTYEDFRKSILKVTKTRVHKITKSLGVYDAYKYIRKHKWFNIGRPVSEHEFYSIIRTVNKYLATELANGNEVVFPCRMGKLELRKTAADISVKDGKIKTNLPIDWNRTLKLWYEDQESKEKKTLVKAEEKEIFRVVYNRLKANYNNKCFYQFNVNKLIRTRLKDNIDNNIIDAFNLKKKG